MASKLDTVCRDGVFYIQLAEGFERHDIATGLGKLRLNTYPPLLAMLHRLGLDWESAGKCWGVCISSLAVLPLFGWVRRQFDDRLAAVASLLYAVHPKLIEWSPELVRDQTFWFFWTMSLYAAWRAVREVRWTWYLAAGIAIALALHTRFEGWCLYLPLVWWSACRWLSRVEYRRAIVAQVTFAFAVCPLLIWSVNVTWLADEPRWELGNFTRLEYVAIWFRAAGGAGPELPAVSNSPAPAALAGNDRRLAADQAYEAGPTTTVAPPAPRNSNRLLWLFVNALRRGIGALFGPLWLIGFFVDRGTWFRRDQVVLFLVAAAVIAGIWIHLWYAQATSSRYFLTLVLIAAPCAACGCLRMCDFLGRLLQPRTAPHSSGPLRAGSAGRLLPLAAMIVLLSACGIGEALADRHEGRRREAALGHWILAEFGPGLQLAASDELDILAYYARGTTTPLTSGASAPHSPATARPDLAVLSRHGTTPQRFGELVAGATAAGFVQIDAARLPPNYDWRDLVVLKR
jgi:hypothetical protein